MSLRDWSSASALGEMCTQLCAKPVCVVVGVWLLVAPVTCQSGEIGPDMITLVFLSDKPLIQESALKMFFPRTGLPKI